MEIIIRKARLEDVNEIYNVIRVAFERYREVNYPEVAIQSAIITKSEIRKRINAKSMLVAVVNGQVVGTVTGTIEHESLHIKTLAVHPDFQKRGVGTRLMEEMERQARQYNCYKIFAFTTSVMRSAIHLYKKCGYRKEGVLRRHYHGVDLIVFGKILRHPNPYATI